MPTSSKRLVSRALLAMRAAESSAPAKEASASACWRRISASIRARPVALDVAALIGSAFHATGRKAGDQGFLQEEGDYQWRQRRQDPGGRDQRVVRGPAGGKIGDGNRQGLGSQIVGIEKGIEELVPGHQHGKKRRRAEPGLG